MFNNTKMSVHASLGYIRKRYTSQYLLEVTQATSVLCSYICIVNSQLFAAQQAQRETLGYFYKQFCYLTNIRVASNNAMRHNIVFMLRRVIYLLTSATLDEFLTFHLIVDNSKIYSQDSTSPAAAKKRPPIPTACRLYLLCVAQKYTPRTPLGRALTFTTLTL